MKSMRPLQRMQLLHILPVRTGVTLAVPQPPKHDEEPRSQQSAQHGADPVDPVVGRELASHYGRPEAARRVQGGAG